MKTSIYKRILFVLLALLLCFSCASCAKDPEGNTADVTAEGETETRTADSGEERIPVPTATEEEELVNEIPDEEMLGKIGAWRGWGGSGTLSEYDQYTIKTIKSKKDLDPYRPYLSNFTEADEKKILADDGGTCVLVELTAIDEHTLYGTSSIIQGGNAITIIISTDEVEDVLPKYTFFLLHFPEQYYNGEIIELAF